MAAEKTFPDTAAAGKGPFEADLIVSLGHNCEMAYNLRQFYSITETGLLDWTITPLTSLPAMIRRRFALVDSEFTSSLVRVEVGGKESIMHIPTGIMLFHAFTRADDGTKVIDNWRSESASVADKFRFLGERMDRRISASASPAIFINGCGHHETSTHRPDITHIHAEIIDAFRETYLAADPVFCLFRGWGPSTDYLNYRSDVRTAVVGNFGDWHDGEEGHWAGCRTAWREALSSMNVWLPALRPSRALRRCAGG